MVIVSSDLNSVCGSVSVIFALQSVMGAVHRLNDVLHYECLMSHVG